MNPNLIMYVQDHGILGCSIVLAENLEDAKEMLKKLSDWHPRDKIKEYPVASGLGLGIEFGGTISILK